MKKFALMLLFTALAAFGQVNNPNIVPVSIAPSGACSTTLPLQLVTPAGTLYSCQSGTWTAFGTGTGSGTVTSVGGAAPLFTVTNPTTTPTFTLSNAAAQSLWGNPAGSSGTPIYTSSPVVSGSLTANGLNSSGTTNGQINLVTTGTPGAAPPSNAVQLTVPNTVTPYAVTFPGAAAATNLNVPTISTTGQLTWTAQGTNCCASPFIYDAFIYGGLHAAVVAAVAEANATGHEQTVYLDPMQSGAYTTAIGEDLTGAAGQGACVNIVGPGYSQFPGGLQTTIQYIGPSPIFTTATAGSGTGTLTVGTNTGVVIGMEIQIVGPSGSPFIPWSTTVISTSGGNTIGISNNTTGVLSGTAVVIGYPVIKHTTARSSFGCHYQDFTIDGQGNSLAGLETFGMLRSNFDRINVIRTATGTNGDIITGSGAEYEQHWDSIMAGLTAASLNWATCVTPTPSAAPTSCTSIGNSGGTGYLNPIAVVNGCTTIGTATITNSSGVITAASFSGYSGCTNPAIFFVDRPGPLYSMITNNTDSAYKDIRVYGGSKAAFVSFHGANTYDHIHPQVGQSMGFEDHGGSDYYAPECDTTLQYCGGLYGYNTHVFGGRLVVNTGIASATGSSLWFFDNPATAGQNSIKQFSCSSVPTGGMANLYNVNGTFFAVHNGGGLPTGTSFDEANNCSNATTGTNYEQYGTTNFNSTQVMSGGSQFLGNTAATSGANQFSPNITICSREWTGSADSIVCPRLATTGSASGVPAQHFLAYSASTTELAPASATGFEIAQYKTAVSGTNQNSQVFMLCSSYFNVSAFQDCIGMNVQVGTGAAPTNTLHLGTHPVGSLAGQTISMDLPVTMTTALAPTSGGTGDNTTPTAGQIYIAQSGTDVAPRTISGDATVAVNGAWTNTKVNGGAIPLSSAVVGTSGTGTIVAPVRCNSSANPAVCGADSAGFVNVAAAATTVVVNTTIVTATSSIELTFDSSLGASLGVTCNTTPTQPTVSARTAGTSFTITVSAAPVTNPACFSYAIY
jgi:hypothetical protein